MSSEWWRGSVIYQVYPRSFADSNGDGIGDLPGIAGRLDHIAGLGVDAIWLSPFFASPMKDFGYDVADYCAVDPRFGTLDDFDRLVARAHALDLKVIIDQVWSHTSDQHGWFAESRLSRDNAKIDWYVWADPKPDGTAPNNWLSVFGGSAWTWEPRRRQYYLHHFLSNQPQLNLHNPEVVDALLQTGAFWLDRGVDGFRLDAIDFMLHDPHLRDNPARAPADGIMPTKPFGLQRHLHDMLQPEIHPLLARIRAFVERWPGAALLGEVSSEAGALGRCGHYTAQSAGRLHMAYTLRVMKAQFSADMIAQAIAEAEAGPADGWLCWAFSNHDVERVASRWNDGRAEDSFSKLAMALLLSLKGTVCMYQGEELGLPEAELTPADMQDPYGIAFYPTFRGRDGSRTPMPWTAGAPHAGFTTGNKPWLPVPEAHRARAVDRQSHDPNSPLAAWRGFLRFRNSQPALRKGAIRLLDTPEPVVAFERSHGATKLLCVFNLSAEPVRVRIDSLSRARPLDGHGFAAHAEGDLLILPAHGAYFAEHAESKVREPEYSLIAAE